MVRDFVSFANRAATLMMSVTLARVYASYLYLLCFFLFFHGLYLGCGQGGLYYRATRAAARGPTTKENKLFF